MTGDLSGCSRRVVMYGRQERLEELDSRSRGEAGEAARKRAKADQEQVEKEEAEQDGASASEADKD